MQNDAKALAKRLAELERRLASVERAGQLSRSSVMVDGKPVRVADSVSAAVRAELDAADAVARASTAEAKADGAVVTFYGSATPSDPKVGDLWVRDGLTDVYDGAGWSPVSSQAVVDALAAAQDAQAAADGKVTTYFGPTAPTASGVGDVWFDTDDGNRMYRWNGSSWVDVRDAGIGKAQSDATTALTTANGKNKVTYGTSFPAGPKVNDLFFQTNAGNRPWRWTGASWVLATFADAAIAGLNVGKLVSGEIAAGQRIIAGPENGTHAEMSDTGFRVYAADTGEAPTEVIRLGTDTNDYFAVTDDRGRVIATVDDTGRASFREVVADAFTYKGSTLDHTMDDKAEGSIVYGYTTADLRGDTYTKVGYFETSFIARPNRAYKISVTGKIYSEAGGHVGIGVRLTDDGSAPTVNSYMYLQAEASGYTATLPRTVSAFRDYNPGNATKTVRMLVTAESINGKLARISANDSTPLLLFVEDMGLYKPHNTVVTTGGAQLAVRRTNEWGPAWVRSWRGDGSIRTDSELHQGYYSGTHGNQMSAWAWPDLVGELAGAQIERVEVFHHADHWYYNNGGTAVIGSHSALGRPGAFPGSANTFHSISWPKPGGRWVDVTSWAAGIKNGSIRGVSFGPAPSHDRSYYGTLNGGAPRIRITYVK